jgi:hypothetical protein
MGPMTTDDDNPPGPGTESVPAPMVDAATEALRLAVVDIERHVARGGWDAPVAVFALVRTADALRRTPDIAAQLPAEAVAAAEQDTHHLTSIEQEGLPPSADLEQLLAQLAWPDGVDGAALVVERIVVPPEAERPGATVDDLMAHPERQDVRIAVGVLRAGPSWCALRTRKHDSDDAVGGSPDAVPGLVEALRATFEADVPG